MPDEKIDEKQDAQKAEPEAEAKDGREAAPQDGSDETAGGGEVADKHGQPGINREKYARDMKARDDKIAELQAQLDEKAKTEEGRASLKKELDDLKAEMAGERVAHKLEMAGCRNAKAAKALLDDYDGDVDKLKEGCPYLFEGKKAGSTGLKLNAGPVYDRRSTEGFQDAVYRLEVVHGYDRASLTNSGSSSRSYFSK